ncbi:MAG: hypothetical protein ACR2JD_09225 [Nocardioides sp.]
MSSTLTRADSRRAWGWVGHLRRGGTTQWAAWTGETDEAGRFLPGAQQLELLRRVNVRATTGVPVTLASRVLVASAPGRGRPDLELAGAGVASPFGPRPIDPAILPADELVRVATSLLADDVVAAGLPPVAPSLPARPWRRSYRLVGDPVLADPLRAQLVARGRPPGGRNPLVLVLGCPADRMLADAFEARALDTGGPSWPEWLAILIERDQLAPRVDLAAVAAHWARRTGRGRVTLVLDPAAVPRLVGIRRRLIVPTPLSAEAVDLARRVAGVLGLLVTPEHRRALLRGALAPRLRGLPGAALGVPEEHRAWLTGRAGRMRRELLRAGYPVEGAPPGADHLDGVLPTYPPDAAVHVADDEVLELAIGLLLGGDPT